MTHHDNRPILMAIVSLMTLLFISSTSWAQGHKGHNDGSKDHTLKEIPVQDLHKPGPLLDISIGKSDAKITIIEYASMTCGHCGRFHRDILPKLKAKYIDTGIARLVVREFPLEKVALAVSMLARCTNPDRRYEFIAALFNRQQQWLQKGNIRPNLVAISSEFGMTESAFDKCLKDKPLRKKIMIGRKRAIDNFGVKSTPTFFINGKPLAGPQSMGEFDKIIQPMLKQ